MAKTITFDHVFGRYTENMPLSVFLDNEGKKLPDAKIFENAEAFLKAQQDNIFAKANQATDDDSKLAWTELAHGLELEKVKHIINDWFKSTGLPLDKTPWGADHAPPADPIEKLSDEEYKEYFAKRYLEKINNYKADTGDDKINPYLISMAEKLSKVHKEKLQPLQRKIKPLAPNVSKINLLTIQDVTDINSLDFFNLINATTSSVNVVNNLWNLSGTAVGVFAAFNAAMFSLMQVVAAIGTAGLVTIGLCISTLVFLTGASKARTKAKAALMSDIIEVREVEREWQKTFNTEPRFSSLHDRSSKALKNNQEALNALLSNLSGQPDVTAKAPKKWWTRLGSSIGKNLASIGIFVGQVSSVVGLYIGLQSVPWFGIGTAVAAAASTATLGIGLGVGVAILAIGLGVLVGYGHHRYVKQTRALEKQQQNYDLLKKFYEMQLTQHANENQQKLASSFAPEIENLKKLVNTLEEQLSETAKVDKGKGKSKEDPQREAMLNTVATLKQNIANMEKDIMKKEVMENPLPSLPPSPSPSRRKRPHPYSRVIDLSRPTPAGSESSAHQRSHHHHHHHPHHHHHHRHTGSSSKQAPAFSASGQPSLLFSLQPNLSLLSTNNASPSSSKLPSTPTSSTLPPLPAAQDQSSAPKSPGSPRKK